MQEIENAGVRFCYELSGDEQNPGLVLAHSLGSNLHMWDKIAEGLARKFRLLRFDMRGHGKSGVPPGPYTIEELGQDVLLLLDRTGIEQADFCGLSLGGLVALWLGIHAAERIGRLVLANTAARIGSRGMWDERIAMAQQFGMEALAEKMPERWFTPDYRDDHTEEMKSIRQMVMSTAPEGYAGCCAVLRDTDLSSAIGEVLAPCLVITGTYDPATPPADGRQMHKALRQSSYVELRASHLSAWERPDEFGGAVLAFLETAEVSHG